MAGIAATGATAAAADAPRRERRRRSSSRTPTPFKTAAVLTAGSLPIRRGTRATRPLSPGTGPSSTARWRRCTGTRARRAWSWARAWRRRGATQVGSVRVPGVFSHPGVAPRARRARRRAVRDVGQRCFDRQRSFAFEPVLRRRRRRTHAMRAFANRVSRRRRRRRSRRRRSRRRRRRRRDSVRASELFFRARERSEETAGFTGNSRS